jgi:hypothetical protein
MRKLAGIMLFAGSALNAAEPGEARLVVAVSNAKLPMRTRAFLQRRLKGVGIESLQAAEQYRNMPNLPTPICVDSVWYLFSATGSLVGHGCLSFTRAMEAEPEIRRALLADVSARRPQKTANSDAIDATIAAAAAGQLPEARSRLKDLETRKLSREEEKLVRRLRLHLGQAR